MGCLMSNGSAPGTAVIWRELDRLMEDEAGDRRDEIVNEKLEAVGRHLSLVFHRFLSGEIKGHARISLTVNGRPITAFDPFCRKNPATQVLPEEIVRIGEAEVRLQPYVLPHHSRLSASEYDYYRIAVTSSPIRGYVYRNGRLMAWGDWFRLVPKGEATKLARVQIDFPNSTDEAWTIDIKKSRARPPHGVRELRQIINRITARSVTVHRGVGRSSFRRAKPRSGSATPITAASVSQSTSSTRSSHPWAQDFRPRMWICFVSCWIRLPPPYRWR